MVREELVSLSPRLNEWAVAELNGSAAPRFDLDLLGRKVGVTVAVHETGDDDSGVVRGSVEGIPGSLVVLAYVGEATAGTVMLPSGELYRVRYAGNGLHRVAELDPAAIPHCGGAVSPPAGGGAQALSGGGAMDATAMAEGGATSMPGDSAGVLAEVPSASGEPGAAGDRGLPMPANRAAAARARLATVFGKELAPSEAAPVEAPNSAPLPEAQGDLPAAPAPMVLADAVATVDLLVGYTALAASRNGGTAGIVALINASVATANTAHTNSGTGLALRVVGTTQVSYTESGSLATDLPRLMGTSDGYMDTIHALRDAYKADIVSLFVGAGTDAAGIGYLWSPSGNASFPNYAFNVVMDVYADANLTLAHEIGHNLGCGHANGDGGGGAYSYSYGWKFTASGTAYRTVMAYAPGIRIPYFSNPNVSYLGVATGTAGAYNAQTIINSRAYLAAMRTGLTAAEQAWVPVASGDFDGDGQTDLIWRNTSTGRVIVWYMNGTTRVSTANVWTGDAAWVPIASADFNADGKPDLVWRNSTTGRVIVWLLNGITATSTITIWSGDSAWAPVAAGDFNADGKPDLVWRNSTTGRVIVWYLNGTTTSGTATLWSGDAAWRPIAAADFNADGKPDLLWRNTSTGRVVVWYLNGVTTTSTGVVWSGSAAWVPITVGNLGGDSQADTIWRNSADGRVLTWVMSGLTSASTAFLWQ